MESKVIEKNKTTLIVKFLYIYNNDMIIQINLVQINFIMRFS